MSGLWGNCFGEHCRGNQGKTQGEPPKAGVTLKSRWGSGGKKLPGKFGGFGGCECQGMGIGFRSSSASGTWSPGAPLLHTSCPFLLPPCQWGGLPPPPSPPHTPLGPKPKGSEVPDPPPPLHSPQAPSQTPPTNTPHPTSPPLRSPKRFSTRLGVYIPTSSPPGLH